MSLGIWRHCSRRAGHLIAIVDAGPLYAAADSDDTDHDRCVDVLRRRDLQLVVPTMVVAEATYFVGTRLGARAEAAFLRGIASLEVEAPSPDDWQRIADLVERYGDFPLGGADASVIALAERVGASVVVTLDRRHFGAVQPLHRKDFDLLPA
jgi:predicted nucleic acid-binding protein